ncbi:winged helix-turn-helix domain-containing protein [Pseudoalteromonas sp. SWXJ133]|jgi:DNA-binding winged helix-turn-helix (wHTH) protein|uniref:winged helix-turn-helix domain-containing protein n=1 Tax=unclassified Pseudoalteromonas TaxID=194690 RepID=UPI00140C3E4D|nr:MULTISPECIES: winged helix-turn-helix domain-containing protein [unclassified Pseudoalteromonas]MBH0022022.1 winged helix-turn-helix domain-containing protein [Pseudoalteromonas sp. SWXJ133]
MKEANFPRSVKEVKFGAWSLNPKLQIISDGEVERELEPLLFKVLSYLIINKDEIITRQNLIDDVWCQHYVDDNAINRAMSELRKVLKSEIQRGLVVKTHYRKGYSFFLEPEIIYYEEEPSTSGQVNILKETPNKMQKKVIGFIVILVLGVIGSIYIFQSLLNQNDYKQKDTLSKVGTKSPNIVEKKFNEETLSWLQGVYSQMILSPNNSTVALSFLGEEQLDSVLLLKNLNTGQEIKISEANANISPAGWSIDSERAIYSVESKGKCELWEVGLTSNADSKFLFNCESSYPINAINIDNNSLIYSKYGYRNRSELSVLVNRNLSTGEEFQISSPNLNSYGDKFLYFIKNKNKIIFERHQFNSSELYMTDLEGGAQIKLFETKNRIWSINYQKETDSLLWYDNTEEIFYQYSLNNNRIKSKTKVHSRSRYSATYPINNNNVLGLIYPFFHNVYRLDLTSKNFERVSKYDSRFASSIGENLVFLSNDGESIKLNTVFKDGKVKSKKVSFSYRDFKISSDSQEAFGVNESEIEILNYENLSVRDVITPKGNLISASYLLDKNIGYIVQDESGASTHSYIFNRVNSKSILLPVNNALWFGQLQNNKIVFLNNLGMLIFFDLSTGVQTTGLEVKQSTYKHSLSINKNKVYHSTGKAIYEYDFAESVDILPKKVFEVSNAEDVILNVNSSSSDSTLTLEIVELLNNELVRLSLEKSD